MDNKYIELKKNLIKIIIIKLILLVEKLRQKHNELEPKNFISTTLFFHKIGKIRTKKPFKKDKNGHYVFGSIVIFD